MKNLESLKITQLKLQEDRPSPETPCGSCQICGSARELMTLRVAQFVLKIAQLVMQPRGPGACGLYSDYGSSTNQ